MQLIVKDVPSHGLAMVRAGELAGFSAVTARLSGGKTVGAQLILDADCGAPVLLLRLPRGGRYELELSPADAAEEPLPTEAGFSADAQCPGPEVFGMPELGFSFAEIPGCTLRGVQTLSRGPVADVVRVSLEKDGGQITVDWYVFKPLPLVMRRVCTHSEDPMNFRPAEAVVQTEALPLYRVADGEKGEIKNLKKDYPAGGYRWVAAHDGETAVAMLQSGEMELAPDDGGTAKFNIYRFDSHIPMHMGREDVSSFWTAVRGADRFRKIDRLAASLPSLARVERPQRQDAVRVCSGELTASFTLGGGLHLSGLTLGDEAIGGGGPLFQLNLRELRSGERVNIDPAGFALAEAAEENGGLRFTLSDCARLPGLRAEVTVLPDGQGGLLFDLRADGTPVTHTLDAAIFPNVTFDDPARRGSLLTPHGQGMLRDRPGETGVCYRWPYPSMLATMQFMALIWEGRGLYYGIHDSEACLKELLAGSAPLGQGVCLSVRCYAGGMNEPGNGFAMPAPVTLRPFAGSWYDAAMLYRDWVYQNAGWMPPLDAGFREDTPAWMREMSAWLLCSIGDDAESFTREILRVQKHVGVPMAVHVYMWHKIPFDNDYPHYFPAKEHFLPAVRTLHEAGVKIMPYINGRLFDTRDRGTEDFEFTAKALPHTTKQADGTPFIEIYQSLEEDGTPVKLAVMCPSTRFWKDRVKEIVLRMFSELEVDGVYIDQISAAPPVPCMDPSHSHRPGGGGYWVQSYHEMLGEIRAAMPRDRMLTTESNSEPYCKSIDGLLTWSCSYPMQAPAFTAVYGGAVQCFGRSVRECASIVNSCAQSYVYGDQPGWYSPGTLPEGSRNLAFFRSVVRCRYAVREYFARGRMGRPPVLADCGGTVRERWNWDVKATELDGLQCSLWYIPGEARAVVLFANISGKTLSAEAAVDAAQAGLPERVRALLHLPDEKRELGTVGTDCLPALRMEPDGVLALELFGR